MVRDIMHPVPLPLRKGVNLYRFTLGTRPFYMKQVEYNAKHEIEMLNKAQNHPNIVKLHFSNFDARFFYIVTEACVMDLQMRCAQRMQEKILPSEESVLADFRQIVAALSHIHQKNILHNDIKVDNILVQPNGQLALCDFESARYWNGELTTKRLGTHLYLPPEAIVNNHPYDPMLAEMWALGTVLYTIAHNKIPFAGKQPIEVYVSMSKPLPCAGSDKFKQMICGLLTTKNRFTLQQVIMHPWMQ